jgi:integrase
MAKINKLIGKTGKATWQIDYIDPEGKRIRRMFKKRKDAEAELAKRVSLMAEKRYLDVKKDYKTIFGKLAAEYEKAFQDQASYIKFKQYVIPRMLQHFGEETLLGNITFLQLEKYRNHLKRSGMAKASVNKEMACLKHMLNKAVEWDLMEKSPFKKSLRLKENNQRQRYLSRDEIKRLRVECAPHLLNIVDCAINTGMRKGEILSLRWSQIRDGLIYLRKTKTDRARQIPINNTLAATLDRLSKHGEPSNIKRLDGGNTPMPRPRTDHVFTYRGDPIKNVRKAFMTALSKADIEDCRFHDLRHTFASHLVINGASLKSVQELLGHQDIKMTMRYAHLSQEHKTNAVNLLNDLTGGEKRNAEVVNG